MSRNHFGLICAVATLAGVTFAATDAVAQTKYPSKPIQLVVPYPAGGSDVIARRLAIGMGEKLGQTIVVVNKPGASTQIGTQFVVAAQPDGHTLYVASVADLAAGPSLFKSLSFDAHGRPHAHLLFCRRALSS